MGFIKYRYWRLMFILLGFVGAATGCAPAISNTLRMQVAKEATVAAVSRSPQNYSGSIVVWGGEIVTSANTPEGTVIEVSERPLNVENKPRTSDQSGGRFLALYDGYLDGLIYSKGRRITIGGEVSGRGKSLLAGTPNTFPMVVVKEIHLWPKPSPPYDYSEYSRHHYPYYGYHPFAYRHSYYGRYPYRRHYGGRHYHSYRGRHYHSYRGRHW